MKLFRLEIDLFNNGRWQGLIQASYDLKLLTKQELRDMNKRLKVPHTCEIYNVKYYFTRAGYSRFKYLQNIVQKNIDNNKSKWDFPYKLRTAKIEINENDDRIIYRDKLQIVLTNGESIKFFS